MSDAIYPSQGPRDRYDLSISALAIYEQRRSLEPDMRVHRPLCALAVLSMWAAGGAVWAQAPLADARPLTALEIVTEALEDGRFRVGQAHLEELAAAAEFKNDEDGVITARLGWIQLEMAKDPSADAGEALSDLVERAQAVGNMESAEARIYLIWADMLDRQDHWVASFQARDAAVQAYLAAGQPTLALQTLLSMHRLCMAHEHPWRLQQVRSRMESLLAAWPDAGQGALAPSLAEAQKQADTLPKIETAGVAPDAVLLQPSMASSCVSAVDREIPRARLLLTNTSLTTITGSLTVSAPGSRQRAWVGPHYAPTLSLEAAPDSTAPSPATRRLTLRPGAQLPVFVEYLTGASGLKATLHVTWESPVGTATSRLCLSNGGRAENTELLVANQVTQSRGWSQPLYHEINHRAPRSVTQDLRFLSNNPCRVEIYDLDDAPQGAERLRAGRLLAVDADGDGQYHSPGDFLATDANTNAFPEMQVGELSRSLEYHAWPLAAGAAHITGELPLRGAWQERVQDELRVTSPQ